MDRLTYKANGEICGVTESTIDDVMKKLFYYEVLEEQGLLLKLPCKVGNTVWFIKSAFSFSAFPIEAKVTSIKPLFNPSELRFEALTLYNYLTRSFRNDEINETVFLTKEEAEQKLAELNGAV